MHNPHYLNLSRHNIYYLRFPIPPAFHPKSHASEVRCSLGTRCPREALRIARRLVYLGDNITNNPAMAFMNYQEIRTVLIKHFKEEREQVKKRIEKDGPLSLSTVAALERQRSLAIAALEDKDYSLEGTNEDIQAFIKSHDLPIATDTSEFETLRETYLKARRDSLRDLLSLNEQLDGYNFSTKPSQQYIKPREKKKKVKLATSIDAYVKEKFRLGDWTEKSANGFNRQLELLLEYFGQNAQLHISASQANDIKTLLMNLPKHIKAKPALRKMALKDIAALPDKHPLKDGKLMKTASIRKYLSTYSSFYAWAVNRKDTDENNFKDINVRINKHEQKRDAFTDGQMKLIFEAIREADKEHFKWGALIASFTGARLTEVAQMDVSDIKKEGDIWFFDINDDGKQKKLKNQSSIRTIPIHSKLIELGLLEYVEGCKKAGHTRILHQLTFTRANGFGRNLSRWFNEKLLIELKIKTPRLSFHSLRHWVLTKLQQSDVEDSLAKRLAGHTQKDVMNLNYAQGQSMIQKKEAIEKLWPL